MIDLHTHILPGIDDGARDMDEALELIRMAADNGTHILATSPHQNIPICDVQSVKTTFEALKSEIEKNDIDITIVPATEMFGTHDVVSKLKAGELLTVNNTRYPLVEFGFEESLENILLIMEQFVKSDYVPILAHPERYRCFYKNVEVLYDLYEMGIVMQINKGSIFGQFGRHAQWVADTMLSHRLVAVAASDAHDSVYRTPVLSEFAKYIDDNYGHGCSPLLLEENPRRIIEDKEVFWESPIPFY